MKIEVNISKKYFFILLGAILLLGIVVYVKAAAVDTSVFHGVNQIDWGQIIPGDINVGGSVFVGGQGALSSDATSIKVGDLISGDDSPGVPRGLVLRAGDQDRITITKEGDVIIKGTLDIFYRGLTYFNSVI